MIAVSTDFLQAQSADANLPVSMAQLVLGNYFSSPGYASAVASNGDDASGNYPAAGAVDGDRTELNIGAASGADNDMGRSTWRSASAPSAGSPATLTVTLSQARTVNRIKLYHLSTNPLTSYDIAYYDGHAWAVVAATSDIATGGQVSIPTTGRVDTVDFGDVHATLWRLSVYGSTTGAANVVEIEAYRRVDITSRVKSLAVKRQRDYKLGNPLATAVTLSCSNDDRFFSVSHTPTAAEVAAGFVNSELRPQMGLLITLGFNYFQNTELIQLFTGLVDRVGVDSGAREATIEARDGMKLLVNKVDYSKLKATIDIGSAITYVLNRSNISTFETAIDTTGINIDYFFSDGDDQLSTIRDLAQASGDSVFYFDELGVATYRFFGTGSQQSHTYTSQSDWESGTFTNIATKDGTNSIKVPVQFIPVLTEGTPTGDMVVSATALTLRQVDTTLSPGLTSFSNITAATAVAAPYTVPADLRIKKVTLPTVTHSGATPSIVIWNDSGGSPNAIIATGTGPGGDQFSLDVASGTTIWLGGNIGGGSFSAITWRRSVIGGPLPWLTGQGKSLVGGVWANTFDTDHSQNVSFAITVVEGGNSSSETGTWRSATYDSFSTSIAPTVVLSLSGTYPSGTSGSVAVYGSADNVTFDVNYTQVNPNGTYTISVANRRYWYIVVTLSSDAFTLTQPTTGVPTFYFATSGTWTSLALNTGASTTAFLTLVANFFLNNGTITIFTRSSPDGSTWDPYIQVAADGTIQSAVRQYIQVQVVLTLSSGLTQTAEVDDITVNWVSGGSGRPKYPTTSSFTFRFDSTLLAVMQELADNLGGDSSILNDVSVQAQPFVLTGSDTDTVFQGTVNTPPVAISAGSPLSVTSGQTITVAPIISGGMDTSLMSGGTPAAAAVTFAGGASGTYSFTSIHPTRPVLVVHVTNSGSITDLRIVGKRFSSASYLQVQEVKDTVSIALYGDRQQSISNSWIVSAGVANTIATALVAAYASPVSYLPQVQLRPTFSAQIGDRVTIVDENTDLSADYLVVQMAHQMRADLASASADTAMTLLKIPA